MPIAPPRAILVLRTLRFHNNTPGTRRASDNNDISRLESPMSGHLDPTTTNLALAGMGLGPRGSGSEGEGASTCNGGPEEEVRRDESVR